MEIPRPSRICSVSRRDFRPQEPFFSVLSGEEGRFVRQDIAAEHWTGPPDAFAAWWKTTAEHVANDNVPQGTGETLQEFFERLVVQPGEADTLYILTLLLLRQKVLRYEKETIDEQGNRAMEVYAVQTNMTFHIPIAMPGQERLEVIQRQLAEKF